MPFVTGQYATTGGTSTVQPFQTIERRDVGVLLRVKPQITEGGTVRLVIYQEVSRIQESVQSTTGIVLSKRALESSVVVDDQQIVVLGGLIEDTLTDGTDKVPVLGDMPVSARCSATTRGRRQKTNLMVFLKPTVVRPTAGQRAITSERYDYIMRASSCRPAPGTRPSGNDPTKPQCCRRRALMPGTPPVRQSAAPRRSAGAPPPDPFMPAGGDAVRQPQRRARRSMTALTSQRAPGLR